jgi:O-antigen ligase/tetratricopeptide (TPR) repeat protein
MERPLKLPSAPQAFLMVAVLLAILSGGQVSSDSQPLTSSPLLAALSGDPAVTLMTVAIAALLVAIAGGTALLQRRVIQFPAAPLAMALGLFTATIVASMSWSSFRAVSLGAAMPWITYAAIFFVGVMVLGRQTGPRWLLTAIATGGALLSVKGILEYGDMKPLDPTWRIFAGWVNPNATGAILMLTLFSALALVPLSGRLGRLVAAVASILIVVGITLTQSKGTILCLAVGIVVFLVATAIWGKGLRKIALASGIGLVVAGTGLGFVMMIPSKSNGPAVANRVTSAGTTQDQSAGFRQALWKGSLELIKERPLGYGIGTYRFESARPGTTTQTVFTHQAFLQLAAESGVLVLVLLAAAAVLWMRGFVKGTRGQSEEIGMMKAAILASIVAISAHCFIDSDLFYYGVGVVFFALLAAGQLLAADGVTPELVPTKARGMAILSLVGLVGLTFYPAIGEMYRAQSRAGLMAGNAQEAQSAAASAQQWMPFDGEAWYLLANTAPSRSARQELLTNAADNAPTTRNLRALATSQADAGETAKAVTTVEAALRRDPNNLLTLKLLTRIYRESGDASSAAIAAQRLIDVEKTPYYQIRSLPDLVPVETAQARVYLAEVAKSPKEKIDLLQPAVDIYANYLSLTWPQVDRNSKADPNGGYADESRPTALKKLEEGRAAADALATAYRGLGDGVKAAEAASAAGRFAEALAK